MAMSTATELVLPDVETTNRWIQEVREETGRVIVGQKSLIDRLLIGLLTNGHILLEGVPGLAKTLAVRTLAAVIRTQFKRIQFTPDLLPADVMGTQVYNPREGSFQAKLGPVFANLILADEINRAPAKVQSALLEAMQERQVTIGDQTFRLPDPFLVLATQNPLEQEGTYPLPEAQLDRFMLKVHISYPSKAEERTIVDAMATSAPSLAVTPKVHPEEIAQARAVVNRVFVDDQIKNYIVDIVQATRDPAAYKLDLVGMIRYGASPRGTINLTLAARAYAFLQGRNYVTPHDVKTVAPDVLRHRVIITYEAEAENVTSDRVVARVLNGIPVP
jgi:MoxR-like ATPase